MPLSVSAVAFFLPLHFLLLFDLLERPRYLVIYVVLLLLPPPPIAALLLDGALQIVGVAAVLAEGLRAAPFAVVSVIMIGGTLI